jgi:hypothetical protein
MLLFFLRAVAFASLGGPPDRWQTQGAAKGCGMAKSAGVAVKNKVYQAII